MGLVLELLYEGGLIFAVLLAALFLSVKLVRVPMSFPRVLAVAGVALVGFAIGATVASAMRLTEMGGLLVCGIVVAIVVWAMVSRLSEVSLARAAVVGVATAVLRLLLAVLMEALVSAYLFRDHL